MITNPCIIMISPYIFVIFFFQAEDGIRDGHVTGVQTCALPIYLKSPTLNKLAELCEVMEIHPLTLLTLAYAGDSTHETDQLLEQVRQELIAVLKERDTP